MEYEGEIRSGETEVENQRDSKRNMKEGRGIRRERGRKERGRLVKIKTWRQELDG